MLYSNLEPQAPYVSYLIQFNASAAAHSETMEHLFKLVNVDLKQAKTNTNERMCSSFTEWIRGLHEYSERALEMCCSYKIVPSNYWNTHEYYNAAKTYMRRSETNKKKIGGVR